jgi:TonB family protein
MPLANVLPIYPERALRREIKGFVDIVFTISEAGNVEDIKVLNGYCMSTISRECSIFNDAAIQAARLLKFSPIIDNGVAIRATNKKWTFYFDNFNK